MLQMYLSTMEDVFKQESVTELKGRVQRAKQVVITAHRSPDGDAIGSSLALQHLLSCLDVSSQVVMPDGYLILDVVARPRQCALSTQIRKDAKTALLGADVVFCLDYNAPSRAGDIGSAVATAASQADTFVVVIDHHQQPEDFADLLLSDRVDWQHGRVDLPPCTGVGHGRRHSRRHGFLPLLRTHHGHRKFPVSSVTPEPTPWPRICWRRAWIAARCSLIYDACRLDQIHLTSYALGQKLQVFPEYNSAIVSLSLEELERFNAQKGDTEGLVNRALSIEGIRFAVFVKEDVDRVKMSLRSTGTFSVRDVAATHFNGGGHHNAAGGACPGESLDSVVARLIDLLPSYASQLQDEG